MKDERLLAIKLNSIFIGNQKLFVNPSRFSRVQSSTSNGRVENEDEGAKWKEKVGRK